MSMAAAPLTSWEGFLVFPDAPDGVHYELRDGEVIEVPLARPIHIVVQSLLVQFLTEAAKGLGRLCRSFLTGLPRTYSFGMQTWLTSRTQIGLECAVVNIRSTLRHF